MSKRALSRLFVIGWLLLLVPGLIHAYLLMPFPGSQDLEAISVVYYLEKWVSPLRVAGLLLLVLPLWDTLVRGSLRRRVGQGIAVMVALVLLYFTDWAYKAERMFEEPRTIRFADAKTNKVPDSLLVIGVVQGNVAKAYPVNYLGYHHKVQDSVGTLPVLVTYCTMCRTGRVFNPVLGGRPQTFRLVGARHYNAVIEDEDSRTWWYQATGEAAVGPLAGGQLGEIPYQQLSLRSWLEKYPHSLVLQPDTLYQSDYDDLQRYDRRQPIDRDSLRPDTLIRKSWVVGIALGKQAKAYDWKQLEKVRVLNDEVHGTPVLVALENDSLSFHVWQRSLNGQTLSFALDSSGTGLRDLATSSRWNWQGLCTEGQLRGARLERVQAYQEYWHSWQRFHSPTILWRGEQTLVSK